MESAKGVVEWGKGIAKLPLVRRVLTVFGRLAMFGDLVSDTIVTLEISASRSDYPGITFMAWALLLLQYFIMWFLLAKPMEQLWLNHPPAPLCHRGSAAPPKLPRAAEQKRFQRFWGVCGLPCLLYMDLMLVSKHLTDELANEPYKIYYWKLRLVCESLFEAIPQSLFQMAVWKGYSIALSVDQTLLEFSIAMSFFSLMKNVWFVRAGAKENDVGFFEHVRQIIAVGVGFVPYISGIRTGKLQDVWYDRIPLDPRQLDKIKKAMLSKTTMIETLSLQKCGLGLHHARGLASMARKCKTVQSIDISSNAPSMDAAAKARLGMSLLRTPRRPTLAALKLVKCDHWETAPGVYCMTVARRLAKGSGGSGGGGGGGGSGGSGESVGSTAHEDDVELDLDEDGKMAR